MRLATATWKDVETYLKTNKTLIVPLGSTEQHGPIGMLGTDYLCAEAIAQALGEKLGLAVAPTLCYGMSSHHMDFPGSVTVRPSVYQAVLCELFRSFYHHGFREFHVVNGHGGNEPSARAVFQELKHEGCAGASFFFYNWWKLPEVTALADELFGDGEGSHATPSEVSVTYFLNGVDKREAKLNRGGADAPWPLNSQEMKKVFPSGVMRSDSTLARGLYGERFINTARDAIAAAIASSPRLY